MLVISSISCITVIIWLLFWRQLIIGPQIFPPRRISPRSNCFLGPRPHHTYEEEKKYYGQPWLPWAEICWKGWMKILVTSRQCRWQNHHTTDTTRQWEKWIWVRVHKVTPEFRDVLKIVQVGCLVGVCEILLDSTESPMCSGMKIRIYQSETSSQWDDPSCREWVSETKITRFVAQSAIGRIQFAFFHRGTSVALTTQYIIWQKSITHATSWCGLSSAYFFYL